MEEARSLGHNYIGTEHLLLGLIREGEGVASRTAIADSRVIEAKCRKPPRRQHPRHAYPQPVGPYAVDYSGVQEQDSGAAVNLAVFGGIGQNTDERRVLAERYDLFAQLD